MPGFPFGPMRPNTRAALPLTARVLVPAVRRSAAVRGSGAAAARSFVRNGIAAAIATPDVRICRRVRSVGLSFSRIALVHVDHVRKLATYSIDACHVCCVSRAIADISNGGTEMAGRYAFVLSSQLNY